jgi:hypothetical protein
LEAHECYNIDFDLHEYRLTEIVPLCHFCHNSIHSGRLQILHRNGEVSDAYIDAITKHVKEIMPDIFQRKGRMMYDLCNGDADCREVETNGTWRMRHLNIDGKLFFTQFPSYEAWAEHYGG